MAGGWLKQVVKTGGGWSNRWWLVEKGGGASKWLVDG